MSRGSARFKQVVVGAMVLGIPAVISLFNGLAGEGRSTVAVAQNAAQPAAAHSQAAPANAQQAELAQSPSKEPAVNGSGGELAARGKALFVRQCAVCHGEAGDGAGPFAYLMNPRPRNFLKGKFKLTTTQNQIPTDDDLLRALSRGMPGSAMPPWGHLPQADLQALVAFIRDVRADAVKAELEALVADGTLTRAEVPAAFAERTQPGPPIVVPPEPKFDDLRWFNGRRVYLEACAACHGADGHPNPDAVKFDDDGFPDPPRSFVNGIFKGGMQGDALFCRIAKGMRGTPMPAYEGLYSPDDTWDLIHYVQSLARAGSQDRASMRQGVISAACVERLPAAPNDPTWTRAQPQYVAMTPLWWTNDRIEGLVVQALHDEKDLALRLSWIDPTPDDRAVRVDEFRDGVAIQFSMSSDPPFYMGDKTQHGGVNIWMWKADRQKNLASGYQDVDAAFPMMAVDMYDGCPIRAKDMSQVDWPHGALKDHNPLFVSAWGVGNLVADPNNKTSVESLVARGPGTLAGRPMSMQLVEGAAVYERGVWAVQLRRAMTLPGEDPSGDERAFRKGDYLPVSFAVWNGSAGDRDGKKNISIWQKLVIE